MTLNLLHVLHDLFLIKRLIMEPACMLLDDPHELIGILIPYHERAPGSARGLTAELLHHIHHRID